MSDFSSKLIKDNVGSRRRHVPRFAKGNEKNDSQYRDLLMKLSKDDFIEKLCTEKASKLKKIADFFKRYGDPTVFHNADPNARPKYKAMSRDWWGEVPTDINRQGVHDYEYGIKQFSSAEAEDKFFKFVFDLLNMGIPTCIGEVVPQFFKLFINFEAMWADLSATLGGGAGAGTIGTGDDLTRFLFIIVGLKMKNVQKKTLKMVQQISKMNLIKQIVLVAGIHAGTLHETRRSHR